MARPTRSAKHRVQITISVHADAAEYLRSNPGRAGMLVDHAMATTFGIDCEPPEGALNPQKPAEKRGHLLSPLVAARLERLGLPFPKGAILAKPTGTAPVARPAAPRPAPAPAPASRPLLEDPDDPDLYPMDPAYVAEQQARMRAEVDEVLRQQRDGEEF